VQHRQHKRSRLAATSARHANDITALQHATASREQQIRGG
jgi:hypothetical protein